MTQEISLDMIQEISLDMIQEISLDNGKYVIKFNEKTGVFVADRHGEEWRDLTGDGMVLALCQRIFKLERREGYVK